MAKDANGNEIETVPGDSPDNGATDPGSIAPVEASGSNIDVPDVADDFDDKVFSYLDEPVQSAADPAPGAVASPTQSAVTPPQGSQPGQVTPPAAAAPTVPPQQVTPQEAQPAPAAPQVTQQPAAAQPPAGDQQQPGAAPEAKDPFEALDRTIQANRDATIQAVASQTYQLTPQELEAVATEPEKVLPQLMAKVHVNAVQGVLRHVSQQMPAMVSAIMQAKEQDRQREDSFFQAWPQLDRVKHRADIIRAAQVFRQLNPTASPEDFVRQVGAQVVIAHGLHQQPQAPAQNQQPAVRPQVQQVAPPFRPAGVGMGGAPAAGRPQQSFWEEFVEVMNE